MKIILTIDVYSNCGDETERICAKVIDRLSPDMYATLEKIEIIVKKKHNSQ